MNSGPSSKMTSSCVIIALGIWSEDLLRSFKEYLTIIPRARMGSESIAHEAFGHDSEAMRARGIIVLVKSN